MSKTSIPTITGNPVIDAWLRASILAFSAVTATWIATKLKITDPNYLLMVAGLVTAVLTAGATFVWSYVQIQLAKQHIAKQVVDAALSGLISQGVAKTLTPVQVAVVNASPRASIVADPQATSDKGTTRG